MHPGKSNVGKTSLVERFLHNKWLNGEHVPTVGAAFGARDVMVGKRKVTLGIWDTAGSERYESMTKHYYHKAQGAVVCYDITDELSFEKAKFWVKELHAVEENVIIALVGTKEDLIAEGKARAVKRADVAAYARSISAKCYECSAKTGKDVEAPFLDIVKEFSAQAESAPPQAYDPTVLHLASPTRNSSSGNCNC